MFLHFKIWHKNFILSQNLFFNQ